MRSEPRLTASAVGRPVRAVFAGAWFRRVLTAMERMMEQTTEGAPERRAGPRWSLRAGMVFIGLIALWLGDRCNRARDQRRALEAVARSGGSVRFDWEPAPTSSWISPTASKPGGGPP